MIKIKKILAVIDPTKREQIALRRAEWITTISDATIYAYLCVYSELETEDKDLLKDIELERYKLWLEQIIQPLQERGIKVEMQLDWGSDWRSRIGAMSKKLGCDLIVKSSRRRTAAKRLLMTSSDLSLFKTAVCPVNLVRLGEGMEANAPRRVLMAIDAKRDSEKDSKIRNAIIEYGKAVSEATQRELHVVHAYTNPDDYVHVTDIEKQTGLESSSIHVVGERAEQAIVKVAREINAVLIVMGLSTRSTLANRVFGSTTESILNELERDVLVVITDAIQEQGYGDGLEEALPL